MAHIGCPLLGDNKYGNPELNRRYKEKYQQLCAYSLTFTPDSDSHLNYLRDKSFKVGDVPFEKKYF
jgi:23S rRNA pseudouridine955/2504/2580 synthase